MGTLNEENLFYGAYCKKELWVDVDGIAFKTKTVKILIMRFNISLIKIVKNT